MKIIRWATIGQSAVMCADSGGVYFTTMMPLTEGQVEDINMAMQLEGLTVSAPKLDPLPGYGELIPLADWLRQVKGGGFIDDDGHGYWATTEGMWRGFSGEFIIKPSDITEHLHTIPAFATHVMWFNKVP